MLVMMKNSCVLALSAGGECIHSFGCDSKGVKMLKAPSGVHASW